MSLAVFSFDATWSALGTAVLHFVWQGALVGLLTAGSLQLMRGRSPGERHLVGFGALQLSLLLFVGTFLITYLGSTQGGGVALAALGAATAEDGAVASTWSPSTAHLAAAGWALGVLFLSLRFVLQFVAVQRLKTVGVEPAEPRWQRLFGEIKTELGVSRGVRLLKSHLAEVPMVVGWLSPVVLVPASAFTGIGVDRLRSLLAHELAHVRRRDPWFNAAQTLVETLLFFHPAIWWISKEVRLEREFSCDDSSVRLTGNPRLLAEALAAMEELRPDPPLTQTALGANGGPLMQRIARILGAKPTPRSSQPGWQFAAGLALIGLVALGGTTFAQSTKPTKKAKAEVQQRSDKQEKRQPEAQRASLEEKLREVEAAVKAGRVTKAQGAERMARIKKELGKVGGAHDGSDHREEARQLRERLDAAVASGRITQEQADDRFEGWRRSLAERRRAEADFQRVWADMQAAVDAGRMTQEQARERMAAYKKNYRKHEEQKPDREAVLGRIRTAVEKGELTPAEGKAKIEALQKEWAEQRAAHEHYEATVQEIRTAVEAGQITEEEAHAKLNELRRSMDQKQKAKHHKLELKAALAEIKEAVKAGKLTREDAEKRIKAIRRRLEFEGQGQERSQKRERAEKREKREQHEK